MDYEELRPLALEALKSNYSRELTLSLIINQVDKIARSKGFYQNVKPWNMGIEASYVHYMPKEDREKVRQILWEFILQGILAIGLDENNPSFPFVSITEHGNEILKSGQITPYDPDGYMKNIKDNIPNLDPIIEMYLSESIQAYLKSLMFSSAVMLGVASEQAFLLLFDSFTNALTNSSKKNRFEQLQKSYKTKTKFDEIKKEIIALRKSLPRKLAENLESQFDGIFTLIRVTRNDAGHPSGRLIKRSEAFVNLQLFTNYCKMVYGLIDYIDKNPF